MYVTLLKALLFTEKNYGKADFSFDAQTSALTTTTYSGPVWKRKLGRSWTSIRASPVR